MRGKSQNQKLGDVCHFVRGPFGGSLKKSCFTTDGYAVYEQQHAIYNQFEDIRYFVSVQKFEEMRRFQVEPKDLIMSCSGTMGRVAIVPANVKPGIINQALLKLTPISGLLPKFLKYYIESPNFQIELSAQSKGVAIKNVASVKVLKNLPIPIPPLEEQKQIVAILDKAFELIDKAKANIEKNIENAKELFQSKLDEVFSQKGEGWVEKRLGECIKLKSGENLTQKDMVAGPYPVYGGNGIAGYHDKQNLSGENVIVGRVGALCGNVRFIEQPIWLTDNAFKVSEFLIQFEPQFLTILLNFANLRGYARQAAQPVVSNSSLKDVVLCFPESRAGQLEIFNFFNGLKKLIERLQKAQDLKIALLDELKQSILHQAFSGQLTAGSVLPVDGQVPSKTES